MNCEMLKAESYPIGELNVDINTLHFLIQSTLDYQLIIYWLSIIYKFILSDTEVTSILCME